MIKDYSIENKLFFYGLMALVVFLALALVKDYFGIIAFSLVMVIILRPVFTFILSWRWLGGRRGLASLLTLLAFFVVLIVPSVLLTIVAARQASQFSKAVTLSSGDVSAEMLTARVNELLAQLPEGVNLEFGDAQVQKLQSSAQSVAAWVASRLVNVGLSIPGLLARLFIFLGIVGALLPNYEAFVQRLLQLSPLDDVIDRMYLRKIKVTIWAMFIGIFVIALAQGLIAGLLLWIAGIPFTSLLTLVAIIASMLPLGAGLILLPVAVIALIMGNTSGGILILVGYLVVVTNVDTVLRPRMVSKEAYLSFVLVLLSALGGYAWFGFFGVVYGPVLMILLLTTLDVYATYYVEAQAPLAPPPKEPDPGVSD